VLCGTFGCSRCKHLDIANLIDSPSGDVKTMPFGHPTKPQSLSDNPYVLVILDWI